ncbi:MAG TPA: BrnT family toxin [Candidatus Ozemobacteraceae bacterium]|nr:BrnT family toxin [Candidatus Ozemobacteraceae bacterium]
MFTFEWDENKSEANRKKHGVTFDEASTVFNDDYARIIDDPDHSELESRFVILGFSIEKKLLMVCHCYRENEKVIRLISARKATKSEANQYWSFYEKRI